jgi:hypothetical protein
MIKMLARLITGEILSSKNDANRHRRDTQQLVELEISRDSFDLRSIFQFLLPYTIL